MSGESGPSITALDMMVELLLKSFDSRRRWRPGGRLGAQSSGCGHINWQNIIASSRPCSIITTTKLPKKRERPKIGKKVRADSLPELRLPKVGLLKKTE